MVPAPLDGLGHHAEGAYETIFADNWTDAQAQLDTLAQDVASVEMAELGPAPAMEELSRQQDNLGSAVRAQDRIVGLRAANEMTRLVAELTEPYDTPIPVGITLLDYYGRALQLAAETGSATELDMSTSGLRQVWNDVQPTVRARPGGAAAASKFDELVAQTQAIATPKAVGPLALRVLDEVDVLEQLFPAAETPD